MRFAGSVVIREQLEIEPVGLAAIAPSRIVGVARMRPGETRPEGSGVAFITTPPAVGLP